MASSFKRMKNIGTISPITVGKYIILLFGLLIVGFPFLWILSTSFKDASEVFTKTINLIPKRLNFQNYIDVFIFIPFGRMYLNSIFIAVMVTTSQMVTSALAAYAFSRLKFPGRDILFYGYLASMMLPVQVRLIPSFLLLKYFGMIDTYWALTLPWFAGPFSVFFLRQAFLDIPQSLIDAAKMDGAKHLTILFRIVVPVSRNMFMTLAVFTFMWSWNSFLWPLIMIQEINMQTLPVGLARFKSQMGSEWQIMMAATVMAVTPIIVMFFSAQKKFISSISMTGIKE